MRSLKSGCPNQASLGWERDSALIQPRSSRHRSDHGPIVPQVISLRAWLWDTFATVPKFPAQSALNALIPLSALAAHGAISRQHLHFDRIFVRSRRTPANPAAPGTGFPLHPSDTSGSIHAQLRDAAARSRHALPRLPVRTPTIASRFVRSTALRTLQPKLR